MRYEWDNNKNIRNIDKHGIDFEVINCFEWESALIDSHFRNSELRFRAIGFINSRLYVVIYIIRNANIRVISIRKSNTREAKFYEQTN